MRELKSRQILLLPTDLRTVITGTGRCGTVYISKLLTALGVICGHEAIFTYKGIHVAEERVKEPQFVEKRGVLHLKDRIVTAESSLAAAPYLDCGLLDNCVVIHLVRHPLLVINSLVYDLNLFGEEPSYWGGFIYGVFPELREKQDKFERAALYYVLWNRMIESKNIGKRYLLHRIEDDPRRIAEFLGLEWREVEIKDRNKGKYTPGMVDTIPTGDVKDRLVSLAKEYGYNT